MKPIFPAALVVVLLALDSPALAAAGPPHLSKAQQDDVRRACGQARPASPPGSRVLVLVPDKVLVEIYYGNQLGTLQFLAEIFQKPRSWQEAVYAAANMETLAGDPVRGARMVADYIRKGIPPKQEEQVSQHNRVKELLNLRNWWPNWRNWSNGRITRQGRNADSNRAWAITILSSSQRA